MSARVNFCPKCGSPRRMDGANFCTTCGAPFPTIDEATGNITRETVDEQISQQK